MPEHSTNARRIAQPGRMLALALTLILGGVVLRPGWGWKGETALALRGGRWSLVSANVTPTSTVWPRPAFVCDRLAHVVMDIDGLGISSRYITVVTYLVSPIGGQHYEPGELEKVAPDIAASLRFRKCGLIPLPTNLARYLCDDRYGLPSTGERYVAGLSLLGIATDFWILAGSVLFVRFLAAMVQRLVDHWTVPVDVRRARAGLCPACEYEVGYEWQAVCPECGQDLAGHREFAADGKRRS